MFNRQISEHFTLQQTANLTTDTLYVGAAAATYTVNNMNKCNRTASRGRGSDVTQNQVIIAVNKARP